MCTLFHTPFLASLPVCQILVESQSAAGGSPLDPRQAPAEEYSLCYGM